MLSRSPGEDWRLWQAGQRMQILLHLLKRVLPQRLQTPEWQSRLRQFVPSHGISLNEDSAMVAQVRDLNATTLELAASCPVLDSSARQPQPVPQGRVGRVPDMALSSHGKPVPPAGWGMGAAS